MERQEIYKFVKTIIENGVQNNLEESRIADGIDKYLNLLKDQNLIDSEYYGIMQSFKKDINSIVEDKIDIDKVYSIVLDTHDSVKSTLKKVNKHSDSSVSKNRDKSLTISNHPDLADESYNSYSSFSCGSPIDNSSRSSCGSSINNSSCSSTSNSYVYSSCGSRRGGSC